ncbi:hypothetical protein [Enterobacter cloacae]|uniref:hypothetical protein n=1 Tax=Enterobacter cloacae TaxID=550 RepID=UPI0022E5218E|nr:hypothetical protein [Enterobacter cloacae]
MSDITVDPRDAFEKVFPPPKHVIRCGKGYACTEYNAWGAHNFIRQWEGWSAAMLQGAEPVTTAYKLPEGWVAVPVNATRAMIDAAARVEEDGYDAMHKAMIAAAPQQEVKP